VKIRRASKTRFYPTVKQQLKHKQHFNNTRYVYNYYLDLKTKQYKETKKSYSFKETAKDLTNHKKEKPWLNNSSRQAYTNKLKDLDTAFKNFFKKKAKYPKFKSKHHKQSYRISYPFFKIKPEGIWIIKIGLICCNLNLPKQIKPLSITISKDTLNRYYISCSYETEISEPIIDATKPIVGCDYGLRTFMTTWNGINEAKIQHPLPYKKSEKRLKRLSRRLSRRKKGSRRRRTAKHSLAILHAKIASLRNDFLHKLSSRMVRENQAIIIEDLNTKGIITRWGKKASDQGWAEFIRQLTYKGTWYGCNIIKTPRFYPSSKTCSNCGVINDGLTLKDRSWTCPVCSVDHDRDVNAACNIFNYGRADRKLRTGTGGLVETLVEPSRQKEAEPLSLCFV